MTDSPKTADEAKVREIVTAWYGGARWEDLQIGDAQALVDGISKALTQARREGRREGLEEAAKECYSESQFSISRNRREGAALCSCRIRALIDSVDT